jgi:hypothetical protein
MIWHRLTTTSLIVLMLGLTAHEIDGERHISHVVFVRVYFSEE